MTMPRILARFGYRAVLVSNTLIIGLMILLFATIGRGTPVWLIVIEVFFYRELKRGDGDAEANEISYTLSKMADARAGRSNLS